MLLVELMTSGDHVVGLLKLSSVPTGVPKKNPKKQKNPNHCLCIVTCACDLSTHLGGHEFGYKVWKVPKQTGRPARVWSVVEHMLCI